MQLQAQGDSGLIKSAGRAGEESLVLSDACSSRLEKLTQMQTSALQMGGDMVWCPHTERAAGPHVHTNTNQL